MTLLEKVEPLFEVDYLLPRTFMASLNLREIKEVIESGKMPVEVCCATLNYFLKKTPHRYGSTQTSQEPTVSNSHCYIPNVYCIEIKQVVIIY